VLKVFEQFEDVPVHAPDQEYTYEPTPPEGTAVNVEDWPVCIELGLAEHVTDKLGGGGGGA